MNGVRLSAALLALCGAISLSACPKSAPPQQTPPSTGSILKGTAIGAPILRTAKFTQCKQDAAEFFLVIELNYPGVTGDYLKVFPLQLETLVDSLGSCRFLPAFPKHVTTCSDGVDAEGRGCGRVVSYDLGINLTGSTDREVTVEATCHWNSTATYWDRTVEKSGSFDQRIMVPLGETVEVAPTPGATLRASWRAAPR